MPNRYSSKAMHRALEFGLGAPPVRHKVLDRWAQHTAVCPGSLKAVSKARGLFKAAAATCACCLLAVAVAAGKALGAASSGGLLAALASAAKSSKAALIVGVVAAAVMVAASKFAAEFSFKYTEELRDRDLKTIPKVYPDISPQQ